MKQGFRVFYFAIAFALVVFHCATAGAKTWVKIRVRDAAGGTASQKILVIVR